MTTLP
jgi:hypothetical protein